VSSIEFYAGQARAIVRAMEEGEDPRRLKDTIGYVNLSFHLPPITAIDQLVEAINGVAGSDLESFESALEDGQLYEDDAGRSVEVVDAQWIRSFTEIRAVPVDGVFDRWIEIMSEEEGASIKPSPKLRAALDDLFKLWRKAAAQKAAVLHVWSG
jgi:hypothetical protein